MNIKLYEAANSSSKTKNWLKDKEKLPTDILNYNPDWLLFTLRKFESAENFMFLLDNLQRNLSLIHISEPTRPY